MSNWSGPLSFDCLGSLDATHLHSVGILRGLEDGHARVALRLAPGDKNVRYVVAHLKTPVPWGACEKGHVAFWDDLINDSGHKFAMIEVVAVKCRLEYSLGEAVDKTEDKERDSESAEGDAAILRFG